MIYLHGSKSKQNYPVLYSGILTKEEKRLTQYFGEYIRGNGTFSNIEISRITETKLMKVLP